MCMIRNTVITSNIARFERRCITMVHTKFCWSWFIKMKPWEKRSNSFICNTNHDTAIILNRRNKVCRSWWIWSLKPWRKKSIKDLIEKTITTLEPNQIAANKILEMSRKKLDLFFLLFLPWWTSCLLLLLYTLFSLLLYYFLSQIEEKEKKENW